MVVIQITQKNSQLLRPIKQDIGVFYAKIAFIITHRPLQMLRNL